MNGFDELFSSTASHQDVAYVNTVDFSNPISTYINLVAPNGEDIVPPDYAGAAISVYVKSGDTAVKYYTKELRVVIVDALQMSVPGSNKVVGARRMPTYDPVTGQTQTKTLDACGSANGLYPYQSYIGKEVINPATGDKVVIGADKNGKPVTDITKICLNCPLAQYYEGSRIAVPCVDNWGVVLFVLPQTFYTFVKTRKNGKDVFTPEEHVFETGFLARMSSGGRYNLQRAMFPNKTALKDGAKGVTHPLMQSFAVNVKLHKDVMYAAHNDFNKTDLGDGFYEVTIFVNPMFPEGRPDIVQRFVPIVPMAISAYTESVEFGPKDALGKRSTTRVVKPAFELQEDEPVTEEGIIRQFSEAMMGYVVDGMRARLMGAGSAEAVQVKVTELASFAPNPQLPSNNIPLDE